MVPGNLEANHSRSNINSLAPYVCLHRLFKEMDALRLVKTQDYNFVVLGFPPIATEISAVALRINLTICSASFAGSMY